GTAGYRLNRQLSVSATAAATTAIGRRDRHLISDSFRHHPAHRNLDFFLHGVRHVDGVGARALFSDITALRYLPRHRLLFGNTNCIGHLTSFFLAHHVAHLHGHFFLNRVRNLHRVAARFFFSHGPALGHLPGHRF